MSANKKVGASDALQIESFKCGSCKQSLVKVGFKCNICPSVYHPRCGSKLKICCGENLMTPISSQNNTSSITSESGSENLQFSGEPTYQDLLLKLVEELESKNSILIENSSLLKDKITYLENELSELKKKVHIREDTITTDENNKTKHMQSRINAATPAYGNGNISEHKNVVANDLKKEISSKPKVTKPIITLSDVNNAMKTIKTPISSKEDTTELRQKVNEPLSNTNWQTVTHKKSKKSSRRALVVGNYSGKSSIEGIEKFKPLHVTNLKPGTTPEDLLTFLKPNFTDVKCEALKSKYPESYASFKVLIPKSKFDKALDASCWPKNVSVHHFFQRRGPHPTQV